jgi:hypothetical protein
MIQNVDIKITGSFGFAGVAVEKTPIPLDMNFSGSHDVDLNPPTITLTYGIKGGYTDSFDISITINNINKHIKGNVGSSGLTKDSKVFAFSDFGLKNSA